MAGDIYYDNVSLLLHCDGTNGSTTFTDNSPAPKTVTPFGNAQISTAQSKFGGASSLFDGAGDYLSAGGSSNFAFGTGDFTIECWFSTTDNTAYQTLIDFAPTGVGNSAHPVIHYNSSQQHFVYSLNGAERCIGTTAASNNTFYHVAVCRASGITKLYINGVNEGSAYSNSTSLLVGTNAPYIGRWSNNSGLFMKGHLDDIRVTKGVARYTSNFSVPTEAFPDFTLPPSAIIGNTPVMIMVSSTMHLRQRYTITGSIPIVLNVASNPRIQSDFSIAGTTSIITSVGATLLKYHQQSIIGNTPLTLLVSAVMSEQPRIRSVGSILIVTSVIGGMFLNINEILSDSLSCNTTLLYKQIIVIFEQILLLSISSTTAITNILVNEYLQIVDNLLSSLSLSITDSINCVSTLSGIIYQLEYIIENIPLLGSIETSSNLLNTISELISIIDSLSFGIKLTISESISLQDSLSTLYKLFSTVLESIILSESNESTYIHIALLSEDLAIDPSITHKSIFNNSLLDSFIISIPGVTGQDTYLAYAFNPETNSVSKYTNYNFTCSTLFNGKYLLGNTSGLYEYGGTLDDTTLIEARLKTVAYNFGTSNLKQVPDMYIGGISSDKMIIKVNVDNKASVYYSINNRVSNLHTQRVKFGKGLIGRYFQFELITNSTDTDLESIEFYPIVLHRKI